LRTLRRCLLALTLCLAVRAHPARPAPGPAAPVSARRVLIVSVDGLRPDIALRASMPTLRSLMRAGSFTFYAQTTDLAVTLPSHVSMLTGNPPEVHGVTWNDDGPTLRVPRVPTLFALAHAAGRTTALVSGKSKFSVFERAGGLDWSAVRGQLSDEEVADRAVELIRQHRPEVLVVHLPAHDATAHAQGWGSPASLRAAEAADAALGRVLAALEEAKVLGETLVIVTADHGGAGKNHGGLDPRSRLIPWIAAGPGVVAGLDLTLEPALVVHTEDTFATALQFLGLPLPAPCAGRPVEEAFGR
jgi:predicted AlkP superfamily pyrophosphatase or phosphodiesterase